MTVPLSEAGRLGIQCCVLQIEKRVKKGPQSEWRHERNPAWLSGLLGHKTVADPDNNPRDLGQADTGLEKVGSFH